MATPRGENWTVTVFAVVVVVPEVPCQLTIAGDSGLVMSIICAVPGASPLFATTARCIRGITPMPIGFFPTGTVPRIVPYGATLPSDFTKPDGLMAITETLLHA